MVAAREGGNRTRPPPPPPPDPRATLSHTPQKGGGLGGVPMLRFRAKLKDRDSETHLNTTTTVWGVFQQVCFAPRENAILAGLNIVNELLD